MRTKKQIDGRVGIGFMPHPSGGRIRITVVDEKTYRDTCVILIQEKEAFKLFSGVHDIPCTIVLSSEAEENQSDDKTRETDQQES